MLPSGYLARCGLALAMLALPICAQAKGYKQLYSFQGGNKDGSDPYYSLVMYNGDLYGSTYTGGAHDDGTIFKLAHNGKETLLHSFSGKKDGNGPGGPLIVDQSGNLYDVAYLGGDGKCMAFLGNGCGTVVKLAPDGTLTVLHAFQGGSDGAQPNAGVTMNTAGVLFGTTSFGGGGSCSFTGEPAGCGTVFEVALDSDTETVLYSFKGGADGAAPYSNLIGTVSGYFYGTTLSGGGSAACTGGCGTVFDVTPYGDESVLYSFCSQPNCTDGAEPYLDNLIVDKDGNLYGTTSMGGAGGQGVVFKLTPNGTETVLYSFCPQFGCSDGALPYSGVIADKKGNLYGTTFAGGTGCGIYGCGTVFKLAPDGTETVLYAFCSQSNCTDGAEPSAGLIEDKSGNLYGAAQFDGGGSGCSSYGCGTVFKLGAR